MVNALPEKGALQSLVKQKMYFAAALLRQHQQVSDPLPGDQAAFLQAAAWHLVTTVNAFSHELAAEYQVALPTDHWSFALLNIDALQHAPGLVALQQLLHQPGSWLSGLSDYFQRVTALQPCPLNLHASINVQTFIATSQSSLFQDVSLYYQSLEDFIRHWRDQLVEY